MLTDEQIATTPPRQRPFKLYDSGGLFVLVLPSGAKSFRMKYRLRKREKQATFGLFPAVTLHHARLMRDEAKRLLRMKIDPVDKRSIANISALAGIGELPVVPGEPDQIYFIRSVNGGAIKIGLSRRPESRLEQLQLATADHLEIIGTMRGGSAAEMAILRYFASDCIRGEWFRASQRLLDFIEDRAACR